MADEPSLTRYMPEASVIAIRPFEEADRDALRRLFIVSRRAAFTWHTSASHDGIDFDRSTEHEQVLVACIDGEPVGFASIWVPDSFLHNLFVHPDFLRQGIGTALLAHCTEHFLTTPTLKCLKVNVNAIRFYVARQWRVIGDGESADGPYFLMEKPRAKAP